MATRERVILDAVVAALRNARITTVDDRVYEERGLSLPASMLPALDVMPVDGTPDVMSISDSTMLHELRIEVAVLVADQLEVPPSKVADPIVAEAHAAVMADSALSALVLDITPSTYRWTRQPTGDGVVLRRGAEYVIRHATKVGDLESLP